MIAGTKSLNARTVPLARDVVVIGASAGGVRPLKTLLCGLPPEYPGSIFIVLHQSPSSPGALASVLNRLCTLPVIRATDGDDIRSGHVYVAVPDHHLTLRSNQLVVTQRGPKENGFRPAVDPLFRSAAEVFGSRVVGVVLSGTMADGTFGLLHIKARGGMAIAQNPHDAEFPGMPLNAITRVGLDQVLSAAEMPPILMNLARGSSEPMSRNVRVRAPTRGCTAP